MTDIRARAPCNFLIPLQKDLHFDVLSFLHPQEILRYICTSKSIKNSCYEYCNHKIQTDILCIQGEDKSWIQNTMNRLLMRSTAQLYNAFYPFKLPLCSLYFKETTTTSDPYGSLLFIHKDTFIGQIYRKGDWIKPFQLTFDPLKNSFYCSKDEAAIITITPTGIILKFPTQYFYWKKNDAPFTVITLTTRNISKRESIVLYHTYCGLFAGCYGSHGIEVLRVEAHPSSEGEPPLLVGQKLTGDPNVPATRVSFKVDLSENILSSVLSDMRPLLSFDADFGLGFASISMDMRKITAAFACRGFGCINRIQGNWQPEWVNAVFLAYKPAAHESHGYCFSVIFDTDGGEARHSIDFKRFVSKAAF